MTPSRILVVDDEWKIRQIVVHLLSHAGYETADTGDPKQVVPLAAEFKPELVILDISMPQKDGLEVARELRAAEGMSKVPIIFMTARNESELVDKALEIGASGYIEKPFSNENYLKVVSRVLQSRR